jgi:hypothetical protein
MVIVIIDATIMALPSGGLTVVCAVVTARTDVDACDSNDYTAFGARRAGNRRWPAEELGENHLFGRDGPLKPPFDGPDTTEGGLSP